MATALPVIHGLNAADTTGTQADAKLNSAVQQAIDTARTKQHPYLIFPKGAEAELKARIAAEPLYTDAYANLLALADNFAALPPVRYEPEGNRLLGVSREFLRRVEYLAFAHRMTGETKYLEGAEKEMLAVAAFPDWNPRHFLDVGEMATGMALAYDWLYDSLSPETREIARKALIEKAIAPGLEGGGWVSTGSNWNQVCNAGLVLAALAVMDSEPEAAATLVSRSVKNVPIALKKYEPDGAYPEGATYWGYGTGYTVIMLEALQTALGTTFGLEDANPGFMKSADYYLHVCGPSGAEFNYSDAGEGLLPLEAIPWFAKYYNDPSMMWNMRGYIRRHIDKGGNWKHYPLVLLWAPALGELLPPEVNHWHGEGEVPVTLHRSGWEKDATFFGTRMGQINASHANLDIGSFVLEANGVRWVVDLGPQSYHTIESIGINNWDRTQLGGRWQVYRNNNFSHNTLTVNGQLQNVSGIARLKTFSDDADNAFTVVDMTEAYAGQLDSAIRGLKLVNGDALLVQDEVRTPLWRPATDIHWGIMTRAKVEINGTHARLTQDGQTLNLFLDAPEGVTFRIYSEHVPPASYDLLDSDITRIGFDITLPPGKEVTWRVLFQPDESTSPHFPAQTPTENW